MIPHTVNAIADSINVAILPIIIIPVNGICCLLFYNRLAAVNNLIHAVYRDILSLEHPSSQAGDLKNRQELKENYSLQHQRLVRRSEMIRSAIFSCFLGILSFVLSAISIMFSLFIAKLVYITLFLWLLGALLFAIGLIIGILEIKSRSLSIITMESTLMEKWLTPGEE